jgi:microcin C transport system permease protein
MKMSSLNRRRWRNFRRNGRAFWSLVVFLLLFVTSLFAEFIANEKPVLVNYRGSYYMPVFNFYPETEFGGDFKTEAIYRDVEVSCLIVSGGLEACFDDPEGVIEDSADGEVAGEPIEKGWLLWPPIRYSYRTIVDIPGAAPSPPDANNWLGTDDTKRDVLARVIYGFRLSVFFTLMVSGVASVIGIMAGAIQGYFGGWVDLGSSGCWKSGNRRRRYM